MDSEKKLQLMQAILDHSVSCIYVKDTHRRYVLVSRHALDVFGFKEEEVIGKTDEELFPGPYASTSFASDLLVIKQGKSIKEESIANLRTGNRVFYTIKTPLKDDKGIIYAICGIASDITEQKGTQKNLSEYLEKLEGITVELVEARLVSEQANMAKNAFLANMSHELRTPLNGIIGNISLLLQTQISEKQEKYLTRIESAAKILLEIIGQVLDFSKIAAGELQLESIPCDLKKICVECQNILIAKAEEKYLKLEVTLPVEAIPLVLADPTRLKQVLLNLLGNAIKFTAQGFVVLKVETSPINETHLFVKFTVSDTGIGIPKEKMKHLFEKFWQADASNTRKFGGTGLGLAITKELIERMGGGIRTESQEGVGTTFFIEIPFQLSHI